MELLSPAGNYKAFIGAINAGCDAVYLGGSKFGARAYADNFSDEEIIRAIKVAHLHDVKIYLTVNTLIKEREYKEVCDYIRPFYEAGLDACIVQDLGLISCFSTLFPNMECHISTQGFSTSIESVKMYKEMGAKRVVLARELSLDEIDYIKKNVDIELETFIHGAMCYSYSGQCLFSSCLGGRSGNRGRCAGPCRLPYSYLGNNKNSDALNEAFFLSMKDQCTLEILPKLIDAGIDSLKIEGRMKKPEYSAFVTSIYRKYIDLYISNPQNYKVSEKDLNDLRHIYLRSAIGTGYYNVRNGKSMLTMSNPAYLGNDNELMEYVNKEFLLKESKLPVSCFVSAFCGSELSVTYNYKDIYVTTASEKLEKANKSPMTVSDFEKQFSKLGDTSFVIDNIVVETDNECFISVKSLNEIRRDCISLLESKILEAYSVLKGGPVEIHRRVPTAYEKRNIISVANLSQLNIVRKKLTNSYYTVPFSIYKEIKDRSEVFIDLPNVIRKDSISYLEGIIDFALENEVKGLVVRNYEELHLINLKGFPGAVICGPELYCFNIAAKDVLLTKSDAVTLPYELSKHEIEELKAEGQYIFSYGKIPLMQTANCVYKTNEKCRKFENSEFIYIKDRKGIVFPVKRNCDVCSNTIYNSVPTCLFDERRIDSFFSFISFTDENKEEVEEICNCFANKHNPKVFTKGYYNRGVE